MRRNTPTRVLVLIACCLCCIFIAVVLMNLEPPLSKEGGNADTPVQEPVIVAAPPAESMPSVPESGPGASSAPPAESVPSAPESGAGASTAAPPPGSIETQHYVPIVSEADLAYLRTKELLIPVRGVTAKALRDSFNDMRSEGRSHRALDITAAGGTEVLATTDGVTAKLFTSDKGGTTLYEVDSSGLFVYYYGHLQRYADGIYEGKQLRRGEVIGYVGDTGNAGAGNYHLHFGISKVNTPGRWSGGEAINPYPLLTAK